MFPSLGGATIPTPNAAGAPPESAPAEDGTKLIDLSDKLDKTQCYCRNENAAYPWGNLFIGDSRLSLQSDADEQLILHLSFQEFVKVCFFFLFFFWKFEFSPSPVCGNLDEPAWIILLIIKLFLNSNQTKVKSIKFTEFNRGANPDMNPVKVHIHVNRNNLGFEV